MIEKFPVFCSSTATLSDDPVGADPGVVLILTVLK